MAFRVVPARTANIGFLTSPFSQAHLGYLPLESDTIPGTLLPGETLLSVLTLTDGTLCLVDLSAVGTGTAMPTAVLTALQITAERLANNLGAGESLTAALSPDDVGPYTGQVVTQTASVGPQESLGTVLGSTEGDDVLTSDETLLASLTPEDEVPS
jgi:hypothetical protein